MPSPLRKKIDATSHFASKFQKEYNNGQRLTEPRNGLFSIYLCGYYCFLLVFMNALHLGDVKNEQNTNLGYRILFYFNSQTTFEIDPCVYANILMEKNSPIKTLLYGFVFRKGSRSVFCRP